MRECKACGKSVPSKIVINGCVKNLQRRKYCFECSPFGLKNTRDLTKPQTIKSKQIIKYTQDRRKKIKEQAIKYKDSKCALCGYNYCIHVLEFHHIDPNLKNFGIGHIAYQKKWEEVLDELDKCVLLCANCHREVEYGYKEIPIEIIQQNTIRRLDKQDVLNAFKPATKYPNIFIELDESVFNSILSQSISALSKKYNVSWQVIKNWIIERQNLSK